MRSILRWADTQNAPSLLPHYAPGADERERRLLAAVGGIAKAVAQSTAAVGSDVPIEVSDWWSSAPLPPRELTHAVIQDLQSGRDPFGELYAVIVSNAHRRTIGTAFTPQEVTSHMVAQCQIYGIEPAVVIDPGAGVGAFTLDAASKWEVPVVAIDLNVVALGFLAARCQFEGHETSATSPLDSNRQVESPVIHLVLGDFLSWLPKGLRQSADPALILGNPPYTRHQGMSPLVKRSARDAAGKLVSSGLAGMAAYFLAASLRHLRPSDALCMILPGSWMHARYGVELRRHLWGLTNRRVKLSVFPHDEEIFPRNKVDAVVLLVGPQEGKRFPLTLAEASLQGSRVKTVRVEEIDRSLEQPQTFPRALRDWRYVSSDSARLGDSFMVHRGIATGRNAFFLLTDAEVEYFQIPASAVVPIISSLRNIDADIIDDVTFAHLDERDAKRWLLLLGSSDDSNLAIRRYLARGVDCGVDSGFLARQRRCWFALQDISPAPLLLLPMTKRVFRVLRNSKGVRHTNSLYGLYPVSDDVDVAAAAGWLRSRGGQDALHRVAQRYGGGALKLEPRSVEQIEVPRWFGRK